MSRGFVTAEVGKANSAEAPRQTQAARERTPRDVGSKAGEPAKPAPTAGQPKAPPATHEEALARASKPAATLPVRKAEAALSAAQRAADEAHRAHGNTLADEIAATGRAGDAHARLAAAKEAFQKKYGVSYDEVVATKPAAVKAAAPKASGAKATRSGFAPRAEGLGQLANPRDLVEAYSRFGRWVPAGPNGERNTTTYWRSDPRAALEQTLAKETPATLRSLAKQSDLPGGPLKVPARATAEQLAARLATHVDEAITAARQRMVALHTQYDTNLSRFNNETTPGRPGYVGWDNYETRRLAHVAAQDAIKAELAQVNTLALPRPSPAERAQARAMVQQYDEASRELEQSHAATTAAQNAFFAATHDTVRGKSGLEYTKVYTGQAKARLARIERARAARDAIQNERRSAEEKLSEAARALQQYRLTYHGDAYSTQPIE